VRYCQAKSQQRQNFRILAAPEYLICSIALVTTVRTRLVKNTHPDQIPVDLDLTDHQVIRTIPSECELVDTIVPKGEAKGGHWIAGVTGAEKQVYSINPDNWLR
jgi:ubiquitin C-terminal hydrolase